MRRITILLILVTLLTLSGMGWASAAPEENPTPDAQQASVARITTMEVTEYQPLGTATYHLTDSLTGDLPDPLTWYLNNFDPDYLTNLHVTWTGSGSCLIQPNNDIACSGELSQFQATYNYSYTPNVYGAYLYLGWTGNTTFDTDYTISLIYPDPLVYISSPVSPPIQAGNQLTWYQADTQQLDGYGLFYDPRIQVVYLPLTRK